ncbi:MAG: nucleotidyltransferase family protein, partial [Candidatus Latescibacterota bacterium]
ADSTQALFYHQYFAPLVMHNRDGDAVRLRFRVVDFGDPGKNNPAWDRVEEARGGETSAPVVGPEDQLIHTLLSFASEGFVELLDVLDAGRVLTRHGPSLDWRYVSDRLKQRGFYTAFFFTLERVYELLNTQRPAGYMAAPPSWRRRLFHACWRPRDVDFYGETETSGGRFAFGLVEGGGTLARARWLRHSMFPRSAWVRSVYGRPANLWLRLKFLHDVRSGRSRRNADTPDVQGTVTGINELR